MEDLKKIQEFFSKPLNENAFVEAFKFEKALKGMGYDVKVKYLDDFGKDVFEIYFQNPADADDSIFYDAKKLGYDNIRVFANPNESLDEAYIVTYAKNKGEKPASAAYKLRGSALAFMRDLEKDGYITMLTQKPVDGVDEATKEEETEFHTKLDKLVHDTFGKRKGEMEENMSLDDQAKAYFLAKVKKGEIDTLPDNPKAAFLAQKLKSGELEEYNSGIYYDPARERNAVKAKEASKSGLEKVRDFIKKVMKEEEITVDDATEFKLNLKHLLDKHVVKSEALSDFEEEEANYDELYSDYKYKVTENKPKKGHGEKISKEVFAKLKGKTINYKGQDYKVVDSDEAVLILKDEDGKSKTINLRQFNVSGMIDEIMETIELGKNLNEELCPKGKAYIKKRQAAGEKSSAYLSGRAVKVCKGQMKG